MNAKKTGKSYLKPILIGAAIFTVLVAHFAVSQFIAFKSEADSTVVELAEKQTVLIEPKVENKAPENKSAETIVVSRPITKSASVKTSAKANVVSSVVRAEQKIEPKRAIEKEPIIRKPAPRETKAERLRRAERILTGI